MAAALTEKACIALSRHRRRCLLLSLFLSLYPLAFAANGCVADQIDDVAQVAYVQDGDTVQLRDGRWLRLIGLDTPEIGHNGQPDQLLAAAARDTLRRRLPVDSAIKLRYDNERQDSYGRQLAHGFFAEGDSIAEWLLDQGLATLLILPPDVWNVECYAAAERRARMARRGLWSLAAYQPVVAEHLTRDAHGYHVVQGRLVRLHEAPQALWLNLEGHVAVRIARNDLRHFSTIPLRDLTGHEIRVRGWVYPVGDDLHLKLRHPANIEWPLH